MDEAGHKKADGDCGDWMYADGMKSRLMPDSTAYAILEGSVSEVWFIRNGDYTNRHNRHVGEFQLRSLHGVRQLYLWSGQVFVKESTAWLELSQIYRRSAELCLKVVHSFESE